MLYIGIDLGTSALKLLLVDAGRRLYRALYPILKDTYHALAGR